MRTYSLSQMQLDRFAQTMGFNAQALLANLQGPAKVDPAKFKKLGLEKGMYQDAKKAKMSLTELLETLDPSEGYENCGLDAFERQLAARNLSVGGSQAVTLEEWYGGPDDSRVLFPEFINRNIQLGRLLGRFTLLASDVIATETFIDSGVYETAEADMSGDFHMGVTPQGAKFKPITISISDKEVKLRKHAAVIRETYEHRRRIKANKMAVFLQLIGWTRELDIAEDAVDVLINGNDGNSNPAATFSAATLSYTNFLAFIAEFHPYNSDVWVTDKAGWIATHSLAEFKDSIIAAQFIASGNPINPFGSALKRHDPTSEILSNKVLAVQKSFALEQVTETGGDIMETDKVIDGQWHEIAISKVTGFAKIIANAAIVWDYSNDLP